MGLWGGVIAISHPIDRKHSLAESWKHSLAESVKSRVAVHDHPSGFGDDIILVGGAVPAAPCDLFAVGIIGHAHEADLE